MGERGPKAKPTHLRILEGNPGRQPINDAEPQPSGAPICPEYLSEDAKRKWAEIMESIPPGMITRADAALLEAYCEAYAVHKGASEKLNSSKDLLGDNLLVNGKPSPYLRMRNEAARQLATLGTRLGLSPADRSGLKIGSPKGRGSKWAGLVS